MAKKQKLPDDEKATQDIYQESAELEEAMEIKEITTHKEEEITTHKEEEITTHKEEEITAHKEEEITAHKEEEITAHKEERPIEIDKLKWVPRTKLGQLIKNNKISVNEIFSSNLKIMESEIIDIFFPDLEKEFIKIGQSKGKFGGGKRSIWRQTQKKTQEGNKPKFEALVIIGDKTGHIGSGYGKSKETVPAREKALRSAKLNMVRIYRGCGSWACHCKEQHSIPFAVSGRCGSVRITLLPAPKGTGLCVEQECGKVLGLAGIKDIYSKTQGQTRTKINLIYACLNALKQLSKVRVHEESKKILGFEEFSKI